MSTQMLVLGPGCSRCKALYENTRMAAEELGIDAEVTKVEDVRQMMALGIMSSPALVVDGRVVVTGNVPTVGRLREILGELVHTGS